MTFFLPIANIDCMYKKLLIFAMTLLFSLSAADKLIPRTVLFGNPDKTMVRLSPDGKQISYLAPKDGVLNVWIAKSSEIGDAKPVTNDTNRGIRQYYWAYDNTHLLYLQDNGGDENFRIYSYNLKTQETKLLTPENGVRSVLYGISSKKPNELLIGLNDRDKEYFDVYLLNLSDSSLKLVFQNEKFSEITADNNLKIRFATIVHEDGDQEIFERKKDQWVSFMKVPLEDSMTTGILGFDKKNTSVYLLDGRDSNTSELKTVHIKKGTSKTLAKDPRADVSIFTMQPTEGTIQAVVVDYDKPQIHVLDPSIQKDIDYLHTVCSGHFVIASRTQNDKTWIVAYLDDTSPPNYYIYHRKKEKAEFLFNGNPSLAKYKLLPMEPVVIKSRDGLNLVSYLTLPKGTQSTALPMVLYVHGGPWARDSWGINPVHQWLANRGYAVLSVNYRGSTGFGKDFINAGNLEWSGKMHDDLIDSVNWAIANHKIDPKKISIMGGSYGGYATLVGLTFTPDVFACGVDIVGPSNLVTLLQSFPPYWKPAINDFKKRVGTLESEEGRAALKARSPLTFVGKIQKPLFIAQGMNDPRVKEAEATQIVEAMKQGLIPVIYALYPSEGHGFAKPTNRLSFYAMTEQFLSDILGGRKEPIGADFQGADFILNGEKDPTPQAAEQIIHDNIKPRTAEQPQ